MFVVNGGSIPQVSSKVVDEPAPPQLFLFSTNIDAHLPIAAIPADTVVTLTMNAPIPEGAIVEAAVGEKNIGVAYNQSMFMPVPTFADSTITIRPFTVTTPVMGQEYDLLVRITGTDIITVGDIMIGTTYHLHFEGEGPVEGDSDLVLDIAVVPNTNNTVLSFRVNYRTGDNPSPLPTIMNDRPESYSNVSLVVGTVGRSSWDDDADTAATQLRNHGRINTSNGTLTFNFTGNVRRVAAP